MTRTQKYFKKHEIPQWWLSKSGHIDINTFMIWSVTLANPLLRLKYYMRRKKNERYRW